CTSRGGEAPASRDAGYVLTPPSGPPAAESRTPRRLRRLSNTEMENVLADVLGARLDLTRGFLADPTPEGFDNDAAQLEPSESKIDEIDAAAERAASY